MSLASHANQRLANAQSLIALAQSEDLQSATAAVLLESALAQLRAAYRSFLGELALNNGLDTDAVDDAATLLTLCRGRESAELQDLAAREESGWLGDMLSAYREVFACPREPLSGHGLLASSSRGPRAAPLDLRTVAGWGERLQELLQRLRDVGAEY